MNSFVNFTEFLNEKLGGERGANARLARAVHLSPQHTGNIAAGRRLPPLEDIETWARALKLTDDETQKFKFLAVMEHIPELAREMLWSDKGKQFVEQQLLEVIEARNADNKQHKTEIDNERQRVADLKADRERLELEVARLKAELVRHGIPLPTTTTDGVPFQIPIPESAGRR